VIDKIRVGVYQLLRRSSMGGNPCLSLAPRNMQSAQCSSWPNSHAEKSYSKDIYRTRHHPTAHQDISTPDQGRHRRFPTPVSSGCLAQATPEVNCSILCKPGDLSTSIGA
jgi:hypothetical protein